MKYLKVCFQLLGMLFLFLGATLTQAQSLWIEGDGYTRFFSETVVENIEAKNYQSGSVINAATQEIVVKIPMSGFTFGNSLMQEHFNENYMESGTYPNATFKGKINEAINWGKDGSYPASATGKLTMHGQTQDVTVSGNMVIEHGKAMLKAQFYVMLVDYQIKVPTVVFAKIAEKIQVSIEYTYDKQSK